MLAAPSPDAFDLAFGLEVPATDTRTSPALLAGGLAGLPAGRSRAVFLVEAIAVIGGVQPSAMVAFALSASGHGEAPRWSRP